MVLCNQHIVSNGNNVDVESDMPPNTEGVRRSFANESEGTSMRQPNGDNEAYTDSNERISPDVSDGNLTGQQPIKSRVQKRNSIDNVTCTSCNGRKTISAGASIVFAKAEPIRDVRCNREDQEITPTQILTEAEPLSTQYCYVCIENVNDMMNSGQSKEL